MFRNWKRNELLLTLWSKVLWSDVKMSSYKPYWKKKKKSALPDRWELYIPYGKPIPKSRFIGKPVIDLRFMAFEIAAFRSICNYGHFSNSIPPCVLSTKQNKIRMSCAEKPLHPLTTTTSTSLSINHFNSQHAFHAKITTQKLPKLQKKNPKKQSL